MSTHPGMLLAYDLDGRVIGTLDYKVVMEADGTPVGILDFQAHEAAGREHSDIWNVQGAAGSKSWPEWLGGAAHEFSVELEGPPGRKRISALVHRSGTRRTRSDVDSAIANRIAAAGEQPADIRDLVGGPERPLALDDRGRTAPLASAVQQTDTPGREVILGR